MTDNTLTIKETYYPNGKIKSRRCYNAQGQHHNSHGPAEQYWHENGQLSYQGFCINDVLHNPAGPARQYWLENGQLDYQAFWLNGEEFVEVENVIKIAGVEYMRKG